MFPYLLWFYQIDLGQSIKLLPKQFLANKSLSEIGTRVPISDRLFSQPITVIRIDTCG